MSNLQQKKTENKPKSQFSTRTLVLSAMFTAVLCVSAYISIPLPNGSHITLLNFFVTLIALLFPLAESTLIIVVWCLLGALGIPVFIGGNASLGYLLGPYGGYSFAFIAVAILLPLIRGKKYHRIYYTVIAILSVVLVDMIGTVWLMVVNHLSFPAAFLAGFVPFIPLDLVKAVVAAQAVPVFQRIMRNSQISPEL